MGSSSREFKRIFVTVGTTKFDKLIEVICSEEIINIIKRLGCLEIIIQYGNGEELNVNNFDGIKIIKYRLKPNIIDDIKSSDLVISHAGAGSCIEVLRENKPLIVVINEDLMDNHQIELAEKLSEEGYLYFCKPSNLAGMLENSNFTLLKKYQKGNVKEFVRNLNCLLDLEN